MTVPGESVKLALAIEQDDPIESARILSDIDDAICLETVGPLRVTVLQLAAQRGWTKLCEEMCAKGADVNAIDKMGRSALYYASHAGHWETAKFLLERGALVDSRVGINLYEDTPGTPTPNIFIGKHLPFPDCWGRTPLHQAVKLNHPEVVKLLIDANANVNAKDERGMTPLLLAGANVDPTDARRISRYEEIVHLLVSAKAMINVINSDTGSSPLHHAVTLGTAVATKCLLEAGAWPLYRCTSTGSTALHIAASAGNIETLRALLEAINPDDIDARDKVGRTALHRASYQGHRDCVKSLIDHGGNLAAETKTAVTVIDAIFAHTPRPLSFLTDILDARVRPNSNTTTLDRDARVIVDFAVLTPKGELQMEVVSAIIMSLTDINELAILQHPLVETFLHLKWSRLRYFFFVLVLINVLFVVSLSWYAIVLLDNVDNYSLPKKMLIFSSCVLLFHNMAQVLIRPRHYLKQLETWLSVLCATLALITSLCGSQDNRLMALEGGVETVSSGVANPPQWALHAISVAILFGWMQMMLLIGRFPMWGYYALMFSTVLKNILKVLLAFVCLIVGFALSFAVLFHGNDQFRDSWRAAVKTVVMMMGEYEYRDLFAGENGDRSFLPATSRIVFLAFVMLASIVLMNLMIGLAVSDIQGLEKEGHIRRLLKQAEFMAHLEKLTSCRRFRGNRLLRRLRLIFYSPRDIPTKITLSKYESYGAPAVPRKLVDALFLLAFRSHIINEGPGCQVNSRYHADLLNVLSAVERELRKIHRPRRVRPKLCRSYVKLKAIRRIKGMPTMQM